ncbi:hypothetical protein BP5796_07063 [Coleophoma crateriformis]|uniref:DUF3492 domain-containing protein n=1 Tax=Coleophoma crateriformis TaxID=565419 RepID=A0A3D8RIE9_9HELO|nr:hypothetical protein BP5796_07063 [Coleophoma crateriformis]
MASFFQPITFNPNSTTTAPVSSSQRFLVYTNSILAPAELFATWLQYLLLLVGAGAMALPLLKIAKGQLFAGVSWALSKRRKKQVAAEIESMADFDETSECLTGVTLDDLTPTASFRLSSVKTFGYLRHFDGDVEEFLERPYDLHILPIHHFMDLDEEGHAFRIPPGSATNLWVAIEQVDFAPLIAQNSDPTILAKWLTSLCVDSGINGVAIDSKILKVPGFQHLLRHLAQQQVEVLLSTDASVAVSMDDLNLVSGLISRNACILENGLRRDFFQANKLRTSLARASQARKNNPNFFIGLYDLWHSQPAPAVIRRSHKFANFHGAVFAHGPAAEAEAIPSQVCLGAFDWIKRSDVVQAQKNWMESFRPSPSNELDTNFICDSLINLEDVVPGICNSFERGAGNYEDNPFETEEYIEVEPPSLMQAPPRLDFWRVSSQGKDLCNTGCYDLREELFDEQYAAILSAQEHLQSIKMLQEFHDRDQVKVLATLDNYLATKSNPHELVASLAAGLRTGDITVFQGLDSGFTLPDCHGHFWAVARQGYHTNVVTLYISLKAPDLVTTIVHCYLAQFGIPRQKRLEIELDILRAENAAVELHPRLAHELSTATYSELLFLVEQLTVTVTKHPILDAVLEKAEYLLVEEPSRLSYIKSHSNDLLAQKITIREVLEIRLEHFTRHNIDPIPNIDKLVRLYSTIEMAMLDALLENDEDLLARLSAPVFEAYESSPEEFDVCNDLYALFFFCSLRRRAFEEVCMETTDRCPLFLQQHDQAAVFAELWMLGSQCEIYFGIKPRALGRIIYDDYRDYLKVHPPPVESWNGIDVFSAFSKGAAEIEDIDLESIEKQPPQSVRERLVKGSFLSIFCVPAMVDVGLLTFVGRGLYLTAFMTLEERVMANYAILASLLLTAGVTGWSGSTGGFYLYQSAYHNMNHFMVHSVSGGFMITLLLAVCGFFAFAREYSWYAGSLFAAYLIVLSTYLNLLGIMATMHREGAPFKSGRTVLGQCLLITLLSPLITSFVNGHDVWIYLLILYVFLGVLIYNYALLCREWGTWPEKIYQTKEQEILDWHEKKEAFITNDPEKKHPHTGDVKLRIKRASEALMIAIKKYSPRSKNKDPYVAKLAAGHEYVVWLLKKESNGQPLPVPYSGTWIVQTKLAVANQQQIGRGLKEHSPFLLFHVAKYDLAQNVGLFLVALLDRWIAITMSGNGHGINMYYNHRARYGVAFGLLYFLLCAVSLDVVLQRYWGQTGRQSSERLGNILDFASTEAAESRQEKRRWFRALRELFWVMVGIFGMTTLGIWLFVSDHKQIILYLAYVVGYSSVIIFQFNRVFTMDIKIHVRIVFMSAFGGYVIGIILHSIPGIQDFFYIDIIALCSASISAAFGTWINSDFCDDVSREIYVEAETEQATNWKLHSQKLVGSRHACSRLNTKELEKIQGAECRYDDNSSLSRGIKQVIAKGILSTNTTITDVFPRAKEFLQYARELWSKRKLRLITVPREEFEAAGGDEIFAGSYRRNDVLTVIVGLPSKSSWRNVSDDAYNEIATQLAAEAMLHECCEALMRVPHASATVVELLLNPEEEVSTRMLVQFAWASTADLRRIVANTNREMLRHIALGCEMNVEWEDTPEDVRIAVVSRAIGRSFAKTKILNKWLHGRSCSIELQDLYLQQCLAIRQAVFWRIGLHEKAGWNSLEVSVAERHWKRSPVEVEQTRRHKLQSLMWHIYDISFLFLTFVATISRAGSDCGRELWYVVSGSRSQAVIVWVILKVWKVCLWSKNFWVRMILLPKNTAYEKYNEWLTKGAQRTLTYGRIVENHPNGTRSGFLVFSQYGFNLRIYDGLFEKEPTNKDHFSATYDQDGRLDQLMRMKSEDGEFVSTTHWMYSYDDEEDFGSPSRRTLYQKNASQDCDEFYDEHGRIATGECLKNGTRFRFVYKYDHRVTENSSNILSAVFTSVDIDEPVVFQVFWCLPSPILDDVWIPTDRVQCVIKASTHKVEEISWSYDHKVDPVIKRNTRPVYSETYTDADVLDGFEDEYGILVKPTMNAFQDEDLLYFTDLATIEAFADDTDWLDEEDLELKGLREWRRSGVSSFRGKSRSVISIRKLPTSVLRASLWKQWASTTNLDAMTACLLDEKILRKEPLLKKYWSLRDSGFFEKAKNELEANLETIVSSMEFPDELSQKINLAIKPADLFSMGLSKDSNFIISRPEQTYIDTDNRLAVMFTDTGCWPDAPGGVSNCRRDLVEGHSTIRNYALTEAANEFGIPRFNIEKNVQLIKNLPLWGLDGKSPTHGLYENLLQTQVGRRIRQTRVDEDIQGIFVPLLTSWVRGCRTHRLTRDNLTEMTDVILNMNSYFEENDYLTTWRSNEVRKAWREAWLCEYASPNISNPNDSFDIERPTAKDFDEALELFVCYFFVYSIKVPEHVPRVYQSTHHGISSLYGMILKIRRGTTWGIWDHAIMLRESLLNVSPAQCILPIAVQTMLIGAMKVAAHLAYMHADVILPCTAIYNPTWEAEIGSDEGLRSSAKLFYRKIDPITNGISSMDKFKPVGKPQTSSPTAIMLSNVQFIKDVKNAVLAAGVIINDFGFKDYNLVVYGAQDRQPAYAIETEEMISELGIGKTVKLGGFGSPSVVLKDAWLFMNSSLSEGLPLAIGEAALSGVPIVATEVGATAQVLTDADDPSILYGEIVPPNDPVALARAQIQLLAMIGPWAKYTTDDVPPPPLPSKFTAQDVEWISARMHNKADDRQALGLKLRDVVIRKFNGDRYLREHEQMYWVQRHMARQRADPQLEQFKHTHPRFGESLKVKMVEPPDSTLFKGRWQEFDRKKLC